MKKAISILLAVCTLFSVLSVGSFASYTAEEITFNFDYNADGTVNLSDARTVLRVLANLEAPKDGMIYDITGNGDGLNIDDVKKLIGIVTGIDTDVNECAEFNLALFKAELNSVKEQRPGFSKVATSQCESVLVTTRNAPADELNVKNMEFDDYTEKSCKYIEDMLSGPLGLLVSSAQKKEMQAYIADLRKQAKEMYELQTATKKVSRYASHVYHFPINNNLKACLLTTADIKSIECYEEDGFIVRKVTMNEDTYAGKDFPTGATGFNQRLKDISYAKVFNIPDFDESDGTVLNKITFKDGVIVSKIDKLSGLPVSVEYSYSYIADVSTVPEVDENGDPGMEMDTITQATNTESYTINTITKN